MHVWLSRYKFSFRKDNHSMFQRPGLGTSHCPWPVTLQHFRKFPNSLGHCFGVHSVPEGGLLEEEKDNCFWWKPQDPTEVYQWILTILIRKQDVPTTFTGFSVIHYETSENSRKKAALQTKRSYTPKTGNSKVKERCTSERQRCRRPWKRSAVARVKRGGESRTGGKETYSKQLRSS